MNAKVRRHRKINEMVRRYRKYRIETLNEMVEQLKEAGIDADEETVAKDIQELNLVTIPTASGSQRYAHPPKAVARYVRISPRKARLVIDLIRGKSVDEALSILRFTPRAASPIIEKVLLSAVANAEHNYKMNRDQLFVQKAYVDEGPTLKRYRPRARGRASRINKRTSHITVVVNEK